MNLSKWVMKASPQIKSSTSRPRTQLIAVLFAGLSSITSLQLSATEEIKPQVTLAKSCFDNISLAPGLIAFTSYESSQLGNWYQEVFGLTLVKRFAFPNGKVTGALMRKQEFAVEIFYRDDVINQLDRSKAPKSQGYMKVGIYTDADLPQLKQCLIKQHVEAGRIFEDTKLGIDLLHITDPEGNALEIISRRPL